MHELIKKWVGAAEVGSGGEKEAERFLRAKGYRILARNWRNPKDRREELDLVCTDGPVLVFVEVKTRKSKAVVRGLESVNWRKQCVLRRAVRGYLSSLPATVRPEVYRLDVVEVFHGADPGPEGPILHIENFPLFRGRFE